MISQLFTVKEQLRYLDTARWTHPAYAIAIATVVLRCNRFGSSSTGQETARFAIVLGYLNSDLNLIALRSNLPTITIVIKEYPTYSSVIEPQNYNFWNILHCCQIRRNTHFWEFKSKHFYHLLYNSYMIYKGFLFLNFQ